MTEVSSVSPVISVILPVHNAAPYLRESVESILTQTFSDFELIAIDDGSTDGSRAILEEFAARDRRVRAISRERKGLVATLNEGIALAQGEWIARMDADDICYPQRFAVQLARLRATGADFCGGAVKCFGNWTAIWKYPGSHEGCEMQLLFEVPFAHPTVMGKRDAFAHLLYSPEFIHAEDYDIWQRVWASGYRLTNVSDVVLRYRVHSSQVSRLNQGTQRTKADEVRARHWRQMIPELEDLTVERIIDAMRTGTGKTEWILAKLFPLLDRYSGEALEVLSFNAYRMFCKLAGQDLAAARNWLVWERNTAIGLSARAIRRVGVLAVLSMLRIKANSRQFQMLGRLYAAVSTWRHVR